MSRADRSSTDDRVLVIGSGPCGAAAAARLVGRGIRVTMLDSGLAAPKGMVVRAAGNTMFRKTDRTKLEYDRNDQRAGSEVEWQSSRSHGGLSNYWTGAVPRFAPQDFTEGAALDRRYEWPISYDELVPFYEVVEALLVVTAGAPLDNVPPNVASFTTRPPSDWADLASRAAAGGYSMGPIPLAKGTPWMVARRGTEFSSYHCVVAPLLSSGLFDLVPGAHATRLDYDQGSGRVESVDYVDRARGGRATIRARAIVVAAGAIDSTALLLRSTSADFPSGLGNSSGVIGRYLHDHPRQWWTAEPAISLTALAHPIYLSRGPYDSDRPLMATSLTLGLARKAERLRTYYRGKAPSFGVQVFGTMIPRPDTGIELMDGTSPDTAECRPRITLRYDQPAMDNLVSARQRLTDAFTAAGMRVTVPGPFHEVMPGSSVHFGGSVRMHSSPEFGALDRWNRLYDVPNVIVCDSSCFTTGPEKNPTVTAMAIAARAADHLADELLGTGEPRTTR